MIFFRADIVPHVPATSILATKFLINEYYVHCGPEYWINGKDKQKFADRSVFEDPSCSNSLGPLYNIFDHLLYFDVNIGNCYLSQPMQLLEIPFDLLQPVEVIPPLPRPIEKFISSISDISGPPLSNVPILGR